MLLLNQFLPPIFLRCLDIEYIRQILYIFQSWKKSLCVAMTACNALAISQRRRKKKARSRNCGIESAGATKLFRPKKSAATAALRTKNARTIWSNASKKKAWKNAINVPNSRAKKSKACSNAPLNTKRNAKNCARAKNTRCWKNHFSGKKKICENKNPMF